MITLQFCSFDSTFGKIIDWGTQGSVGHVDIVLPDGTLLGAQHEDGLGGKPAGVQIRPADYGDRCGMKNRIRVSLCGTDEEQKAAYNWAHDQIGLPYDTKAIEGIALNQDWSSEGHFICSGLASGLLTQPSPAFIPFPLAKNWRIVTPEELLLVTSAMGTTAHL